LENPGESAKAFLATADTQGATCCTRHLVQLDVVDNPKWVVPFPVVPLIFKEVAELMLCHLFLFGPWIS
jgi:hypothetical protein